MDRPMDQNRSTVQWKVECCPMDCALGRGIFPQWAALGPCGRCPLDRPRGTGKEYGTQDAKVRRSVATRAERRFLSPCRFTPFYAGLSIVRMYQRSSVPAGRRAVGSCVTLDNLRSRQHGAPVFPPSSKLRGGNASIFNPIHSCLLPLSRAALRGLGYMRSFCIL